MQNSLVSGDDMRYLVQQKPEALTTIMGQMTSLVQGITDLQNDTNERVEAMEKQPWYKKMWMTITGKNKASKAEIQRNQDKIISYISEAVAQLYQLNCIDQQVMCSLGNRVNQVYAQVTEVYNEQLQMKSQMAEIMAVQQQTIQALGGFVTKLNEKIESIDNFHMLITEIQQGHYHDESQLYSLCCVLAQLDKRTLEDDRKLNILKDALTQSEIISENGISIQQYLTDVLSLPDDKVGLVYLELCNFRNSFPANLFAEMIETYHFLPKMEKMSKSKEILIQELLSKYKLDASAEFSFSDVSESFLENKQNGLVNLELLEMKDDTPDATEVSETEETANIIPDKNNPYSEWIIPNLDFEQLVSLYFEKSLRFAEYLYMHSKFELSSVIFNFLHDNAYNIQEGRDKIRKRTLYFLSRSIPYKCTESELLDTDEPLAKLNYIYSGSLYQHRSIQQREALIDEILPAILQMAENGDPIAQEELGRLYSNSVYKYFDEEKAIEWLKKSAKQGNFRAIEKLKKRFNITEWSDE